MKIGNFVLFIHLFQNRFFSTSLSLAMSVENKDVSDNSLIVTKNTPI